MKHTVTAEHKSGMAFDIDVLGYTIRVDAHKEVGGNGEGPPPKPLMLASLVGCTGMDVVSMLGKMKIEYDDFKVEAEGELSDEHPKRYVKIHLRYIFKGKNIPYDKVEHAVKLSQEKYCGVAAVYKQTMELTHSIEISE